MRPGVMDLQKFTIKPRDSRDLEMHLEGHRAEYQALRFASDRIAFARNTLLPAISATTLSNWLAAYENDGLLQISGFELRNDQLAEMLVVTLASAIGDPYCAGVTRQLVGRLHANDRLGSLLTAAGRAGLPVHSDKAYYGDHLRPHVITLLGLFNPAGTRTGWCSTQHIVGEMHQREIDTLTMPLFEFQRPSSEGCSGPWSTPSPILQRDKTRWRVKLAPGAKTRAISPTAQDALRRFRTLAEHFTRWTTVARGDFLAFDNLHGVHQREAIVSRRRLLRCYVELPPQISTGAAA